MPVIVTQIKSALDEDKKSIIEKALKAIKVTHKSVIRSDIYKTSLDARKQNDIHFVNSVYIELDNYCDELKICNKNKLCSYIEKNSIMPDISAVKSYDKRIAIAGFGPAGMFAALVLAENGYNPLVFERGECVEERIKSVENFWNNGILNENSNVQFGEGGAGTFSDGKLTTRINDPLCRYILERFVEFGAPEEILTKAKPHIGTDNLRNIVKNMRERIKSLGGEILFNTQLDDINISDAKIRSVSAGGMEYEVSALIMAVGHSARDTFEMLYSKNIFIEPKPFSVGVRIEHKQSDIDYSLYGKNAGNPLLPKGEYQLSYRDKGGRGVYTFCMCPGGMVVPSSSESGGVVTNGMSEFSRNGDNANAAMVVSVSADDFGKNALDGVDFARKIERSAYEYGGGNYKAPATTVKGFLEKKPSLETDISPTYAYGLKECELREIFPVQITDMLETGLGKFVLKMKCFGDGNAVMTAPETRTSSPVRITRTENRCSLSVENLYPCGEGAGYAGGIVSAAVDGIKTALKIMGIE
ncbi:MAG: NAD(P)/FAD-dependent oxidoreductase [Oscillospiraceae bacterium]